VCVRVCVSTSANKARWHSLFAPGVSVRARACVRVDLCKRASVFSLHQVCVCVCVRDSAFVCRPQQTRWCTLINRCLVLVLSLHLSVCLCMCECVCANAVQCLVFVCGFISVSFFLVVGARKHAHTQNRSHTHIHTYTHTHTHFISVLFRLSQGATIDRKRYANTFNTHSRSHVSHIQEDMSHTLNESCHACE